MARDEHGFDPDETVTIADNPFWDATDVAHPAWWRGDDHGCAVTVERLNAILDGKDDGHGGFGYEPLERLRRRLLALRRQLLGFDPA